MAWRKEGQEISLRRERDGFPSCRLLMPGVNPSSLWHMRRDRKRKWITRWYEGVIWSSLVTSSRGMNLVSSAQNQEGKDEILALAAGMMQKRWKWFVWKWSFVSLPLRWNIVSFSFLTTSTQKWKHGLKEGMWYVSNGNGGCVPSLYLHTWPLFYNHHNHYTSTTITTIILFSFLQPSQSLCFSSLFYNHHYHYSLPLSSTTFTSSTRK